jgi:hypothetical protein
MRTDNALNSADPETSGVPSHRVVRVGLPTQPQSWAGWDRCPNGRLLPGELWLAAAKSHPVTTAVGAPRADALAEKLPPRAWQRLSAGPGAEGHRWYERACPCQRHGAGDP